MKQVFFLLSFFVWTYISHAQNEPKPIRFYKDKPVRMLHYERLWDSNNTSVSKKKLKKSGRFTSAEVDEIFNRLADANLLPKDIETLRKGARNEDYCTEYKMYEQSSFSLLGYKFSLVWIPKDENSALPKGLVPPTADGSLFYTYTKNLSDEPEMSLAKGLKATNSNNNSGTINVSRADMGEYVENGGLGSIILYYGEGGTTTSAYIYELKGKELKDKQAVANALSGKVSGIPFIGFEHRLGDCKEAQGYIVKKAGTAITTTCSGSYKVD